MSSSPRVFPCAWKFGDSVNCCYHAAKFWDLGEDLQAGWQGLVYGIRFAHDLSGAWPVGAGWCVARSAMRGQASLRQDLVVGWAGRWSCSVGGSGNWGWTGMLDHTTGLILHANPMCRIWPTDQSHATLPTGLSGHVYGFRFFFNYTINFCFTFYKLSFV